jgi:citrate synthase
MNTRSNAADVGIGNAKNGAAPGNASASGLEGVVVADTLLSDVDGEQGRLVIAGHDVESLADRTPFEGVCALLWSHARARTEGEVRAAIGRGRERAWALLPSLGGALEAADGMEALRASMAHLHAGDGADEGDIAGASAVFAAAWSRRRRGLAPVAPDASASQAADFLRMTRGADPEPARAAGLDAYLATVSDHGMNASTFTARVVASTGSDIVSAVVAAIGALKGPLHGGAPGPVLDMLDAIGAPENAVAWLESEIAAKRRIMGMGHRIYRVRDPRAAVLEKVVLRLEGAGISAPRLPLARAVEQAAVGVLRKRYPDRPLLANVEFYTAVLLDTVGLPRELFSSVFAVSRAAGWCAHVAEQRAMGRLIRPASRYVGFHPDAAVVA